MSDDSHATATTASTTVLDGDTAREAPTGPRRRRPDQARRAAAPAPISPATPEGIGDIVDAGRPTAYPHLAARGLPTTGQMAAAAREAAAVLARATLWPRRRGRWQPAPRAARRAVSGRMRVSMVVLEPNDFVALPAPTPGRPAALRLAHGRAHTVATAPDGELLAVQNLAAGRTRVLAGEDGHRLVNTGDGPAVVVRVIS